MLKVNKRILFILAILCIFILIPCSFASDLNDNSTLTDSPVADENSIYVSVDGNDTSGMGTESSPYQSISKAVEMYNSSANSNIFIKNGKYVFDGRINIDKDVTIVGESNIGVILDGNNTSAIFEINSNNVLISGLTFVNSYCENSYGSGGSAILANYDNFTVDNCIFENNEGGALTTRGDNVLIKDSIFKNNIAEGWAASGSAIGSFGTTNITNCQFINNTAEYGGTVFSSNGHRKEYFYNCTFIGNTAVNQRDGGGSAIYMYNMYDDVTIFDCTFKDNTAYNGQPVIDIEVSHFYVDPVLYLKDNIFENNYPNKEISTNMKVVYLDKNDFIKAGDINRYDEMKVGDNVNFTVNLTDIDGVGIPDKLITITFTDYIGRVNSYTATTDENGQAIVSLVNQTAGTYNVVSSFAGDSKWDAVNTTNLVYIKAAHSYNIVFNESIVKVKAGNSHKVMAYICNEYIIPVGDGAFSDYEIKWESRVTTGSGINSIFEIDVIDFDLYTRTNYFYINFTAHNANDYFVTANGTLIIDTSIPLPPVDKDIEIIYVAKDGSDESGDGSEDNPLATIQAALYVNDVFGGNKTIFVKEGVYDISNYEIYSNVNVIGEKSKTIFRQTQGDDGMLYLDNGATTKFTNITFINGYMAEYTIYGAAFVVRYAGSIAYFNGCEFINNRGSSDGVIFVAHNAVAYFDNCIFKDNSAWTFNAAGVIQVRDAYLSVNNSYFGNNSASEGGAIFIGGDAYANIENTVFYQNKALNDSYAISGGGAIYVNNWNTHITNCSFIENYAEINGGAIYILTGNVEIQKSLFENNHVKSSGSNIGTAIASDSGYTVHLYVDHSIIVSDDYNKKIAIVNDMNDENEIKLDNNYWGNYQQSGTKFHVILKATADSSDIHEGDSVEITVEFRDNYENYLSKNVHDFALDVVPQLGSVDVNSITIINNTAKFIYFATKVGSEKILFNHNNTVYEFKFNVAELEGDKKDFSANIDVNDDKTQIIVEVPKEFENNITVKLDDKTYSIKANNGVATLDINELPGKHTVRAMFYGNSEYKAFISDVFNFTIDKYDANLAISVKNVMIGEDVILNITANDKFSGNVAVVINNKTYSVNINNGKGSAKIGSLNSGVYTAELKFDGNDYFKADEANTTFEILESSIDVIYVSANGSDDNNGSESSPYATISKALDRNKRLGGGKTIIVSEGNYILNRYSITNDVTIIGEGEVVISQNANTNHIYIGENVNVNLNGLTFVNGKGFQVGSIETGSDESGNIGKTLTITNCNFINNTGIVGAIVSYANTTVSQSSFINNTATGKDGYNQAIISIQDNGINVANSIFLNNNYQNEIIVSRVAGLVNDNFWGSNDKPGDIDKNLEITSWACLVPSIDDDVRFKTNYNLTVKFQKTANGVNFAELDGIMPDLTVDVEAVNGLINQSTILISENNGVANYNITTKAYDTVNVNIYGKTIASLKFTVDVPEFDKIYVSLDGNDLNNGSKESPLATIKEALARNKNEGGNKAIIILPGNYDENDLIIDNYVSILGENATIDGNGGNIFTISQDAKISNIKFINTIDAIKQLDGYLSLINVEFINNTNVIVSDNNLTIVNSTFSNNTNVIVSNGLSSIDNVSFTDNNGFALKLTDLSSITNSVFTGNEIAINTKDCVAIVENNLFENNTLAISSENAIVSIKNNKFLGNSIQLNDSNVELANNTNTAISLTNSNITNVIVEFIGATTVFADSGDIILNASVFDDMGNAISGGKITFTSNGNKIGVADVNDGLAILKYPFTKGNHTISGTYDGDKNANISSGLLRIDVDYYWFINDVGYESLADAIDAAELGDIIKGIPGTYEIGKLQIGHRYFSLEPWEVLKSVTITSLNDTPVTLKGSGVQMFFVDIGSELTLKNLIITGAGSFSDDGGAVGTLYNTNLTIINCTFTNNTGGDGGAVYAFGNTNLAIVDTIFDSNTGLLGGAVEVVSYGYQDITIRNVTFSNNVAHYAGAFYNGGSGLEMYNIKFINNTASVGGALYSNAGSITVIDSEFIANKVISNDEVTTTSMGGAFHNMLGDAIFRNVIFINNSADGLGGALELENGLYGSVTWTIIDNCTFTNNTARDGGAIYLGEIYDPYVKITSSTFDSNTASNNGGAISDNFGHVTVDGSQFINNKAGSLDIIHVAGDIFESVIVNGELTIKNSEFKNNDADYVIFTNNYGVLEVSDSKFDSENISVFNRGEATIKNTISTNSSGKVIENLGSLILSKNTFDSPILNEKDINSITYVVILDNETKIATMNAKYTLKAKVVDDNGNIIEGGNLIFVVSDEQTPAIYENGEHTADYLVIYSMHLIDAIYDDAGLTQLKVKTGILVAKTSPNLSVDVGDATIGSNAVITVNVVPQATGNVTITVANKTYTSKVNNGVVKLVIPNLAEGEYLVEVSYSGDSKYAPASESKTLVVSKVSDYNITVDVSRVGLGDDISINVILPSDANGLATVIVDGDEYPVIINNGKANVVVSNLPAGNHNLTVNYGGNDKYTNSTLKTTFKVGKADSYVKIVINDVVVGNDAIVNLIVPNDASGNIIVTFEGKEYVATISNGQASVTLSDLVIGEYNIEALYVGDSAYLDSTNRTSFKVVDKINDKPTIDLTIDGNIIKGVLLDVNGNPIANAEIQYTINGVNSHVSTKADGTFDIETKYGAKTTITYSNDDEIIFDTSFTINNLVPIRLASVINANDYTTNAIDFYTGERGNYFKVQLVDINGNALANKPVKIGFNGVVYDRTTDDSGWTELQINLQNAGIYTFAIGFLGDDNYTGAFTVQKITVNKKSTSISASAKSFKATAKTKKYTVTLKTVPGSSIDGKSYMASGKKVTLKVNGKTYTAKTNSKGQATFSLKLTKKAKYIASISFAGDKSYSATSKKITLTIK